jgi:hypothetical protein
MPAMSTVTSADVSDPPSTSTEPVTCRVVPATVLSAPLSTSSTR